MSDNVLKPIAEGILQIGDLELQCAVLEGGKRVLSQRTVNAALGRAERRGGGGGDDELPSFLAPSNLKPFLSNKQTLASLATVQYQPLHGGRTAVAIPAEALPEICNVWLEARDAGALQKSQEKTAQAADMLMRGLANVGIIALVDEATGYQDKRAKDALAKILEQFIDRELQPWTKTFPYEFYKEIYRLNGWKGPDGNRHPGVIGHWTNDIVYDRLAPGVLAELKRINPVNMDGHRSARHHQWFTPELGHPKLREHLAAVMAIMRISPNWKRFKDDLQRAFPKHGDQETLKLDS